MLPLHIISQNVTDWIRFSCFHVNFHLHMLAFPCRHCFYKVVQPFLRHSGCVLHGPSNHVPKDVSKRDSALSWFESLILAHVNAKLFQRSGFWNVQTFWNAIKRAFWIVPSALQSLILDHVNAKLFRNVIWPCGVHFKNARWTAIHKRDGSISARGLRSRSKISLAVRRSARSWLERHL